MKAIRILAAATVLPFLICTGCFSSRSDKKTAKAQPSRQTQRDPAKAADAPNDKNRTNTTRSAEVTNTVERLGRISRATDILGKEVRGPDSQRVGKVKDLIVDVEAGRICLVAVSMGGLWGFGDDVIALPPGAFKPEHSDRALLLTIEPDSVVTAPKINLTQFNDFSNTNRVLEIYSYYNMDPYFLPGLSATNANSAAKTTNTMQSADKVPHQDRVITPRGRAGDLVGRSFEEDRAMRRGSQAKTNAVRTAQRPATATNSLAANQRGAKPSVPVATPNTNTPIVKVVTFGDLERATKVIGASVRNPQDEKLGKVDDLMVDLSAGRIVHVLVSSGGFLGFREELSAAPSAAFDYERSRQLLRLDTTREALLKAPRFKNNQWPDYKDPQYVGSVYRAYAMEPYFATVETNANARIAAAEKEMNRERVNVFSQGFSTSDVETTRRIRKDLIDRKGLSMHAHNITIVTREGRVTLQGSVDSPEEKRTVEEIATKTVRRENVVSNLEVKHEGTID